MMNRIRAIAALFPRYGLVVLWLLSVVLMAFDYWRDPENNFQYGRNHRRDFRILIILGLIELTLLYTILNPDGITENHKTRRRLSKVIQNAQCVGENPIGRTTFPRTLNFKLGCVCFTMPSDVPSDVPSDEKSRTIVS
jgi:hypothetical protein